MRPCFSENSTPSTLGIFCTCIITMNMFDAALLFCPQLLLGLSTGDTILSCGLCVNFASCSVGQAVYFVLINGQLSFKQFFDPFHNLAAFAAWSWISEFCRRMLWSTTSLIIALHLLAKTVFAKVHFLNGQNRDLLTLRLVPLLQSLRASDRFFL